MACRNRRIAFAISALAGLRPGEIRALKWENIDLDRRRIYVRESVNGPTKDKESREAPIVPGLHDLLVDWKAKNPSSVLVCTPILGMLGKAAPGLRRRYLGEHRITKLIKAACKNAKLPRLTFYEAGRHCASLPDPIASESARMGQHQQDVSPAFVTPGD
jgi:integrase